MVDRKYVMFSTEGNGRMIEMIGDIKPGVRGVGVIVPGTNTNLNGSGSNHESAVKLAKESGSPIFLYLGGDFPQGLDKAADPSYAAAMAPKLVDFGHEVDRAVGQNAPGTPVTYVGTPTAVPSWELPNRWVCAQTASCTRPRRARASCPAATPIRTPTCSATR